MKIHALVTEVFAHGGIQRYNRQLIRALEVMAHGLGNDLRIFSLNDAPGHERLEGYGRTSRRFVTSALAAAGRDRPDVVIAGHVNLAPMVPLYRSLVPRARIYLMTHGKEVESRLPLPTWLGVHSCTGIFAVSESTRHLVSSRQRVPARRVHLLYYGFEPQMRGVAAAGSCDHETIRLLSVARLSREDRYKGIDLTIQAVALLRDAHPNLRYSIIGDGPDRPYLARTAQVLGVEDRVSFAGTVSDVDLQTAYRDCDVFVLPSTHEGLGIVYLEAMAHGKPVIGVHAGGVADVVVHEANGLLMREAHPGSIAGAIERLALDPGLRARLGQWGRANTVPMFSFERLVKRLTELVEAKPPLPAHP